MQTTVHLLIEDADERDALERMLTDAGLSVCAHVSPRSFLESERAGPHDCCLISDLHSPGDPGFDFRAEIESRDIRLPVVFLTDNEDILATARIMRGGEADFMPRPVDRQALLDRIFRVVEHKRRRDEQEAELRDIRSRVARLTPREMEVTQRVMQGLCNKEISTELGISVRTVEKHRAALMDKLGANNVADLCRIGQRCERVLAAFDNGKGGGGTAPAYHASKKPGST